MRPLSSLGIGLSLLFGCLFLAMVAEVYYLLRWKKKIADRDAEDDYATSPGELLHLFHRRKPSSLQPAAANPQTQGLRSSGRAVEGAGGKELLAKPFGSEDGVEAELMRLHHLAGPPRFLFTIKEETKEDLESDDGRSMGDKSGKGSIRRSLGDILAAESPSVSPLPSPPLFAPPPLTSTNRCYSQHGFDNPLFESSEDYGWSRIRSSPPPKFKFLRDAEDKLYRKTLMEEALKVNGNRACLPELAVVKAAGSRASIAAAAASAAKAEEEEGSFITVIVSKGKEQSQQRQHSSSSQVIPLPSLPSDIRRADEKIQFP